MLLGYNLTEAMRAVLKRSRQEAQRLGHEYVGAEHLLLGTLTSARGVTSLMLKSVDVPQVLAEIERRVGSGQASPGNPEDLPYTSRAKRVLELAMREALEQRHAAVTSEHLLLGLLREEQGIAAEILAQAGLRLEVARSIMHDQLANDPHS